MKRIRIFDYLLLLHLFELPEEKMEWWARLTFIASVVLFGFSVIFTLMLFGASVSARVEHLGLLTSIAFFVSGILSFLVVSLQDSEVRSRLLWLSTVTLLLGSLIFLGTLLTIYTSSSVLPRA